MRIGVISDTHGLLRPEALAALSGAEAILHAGDIGDPAIGNPAILDVLAAIAPVTAIRGNIDRKGPCSELPAIELVELGGKSIYMLHDRHELDLDPTAAGIAAVISGHSHQPLIEWKKDVLYFNPGSAGPRRFSLPISLGFLLIEDDRIEPQLVTLG
ncbi:metallophosphoesterase family protein [Silvibacterium sp.]|uniref:metallophosphoesterase family protein n=1 Tax=Silvibacterium sp. TaxID=1964179 RepID=UPI0039E36AA4